MEEECSKGMRTRENPAQFSILRASNRTDRFVSVLIFIQQIKTTSYLEP